ncbi:hypothetical protein PF327_07000 [Sulfurovum sp. XTW-4]|uniref:Uncharacterized protein n=1 Tax=Sulfurovum xiamenensis TaxID=3019066 RepID=A0ABT7QS78_9BACT|nr:hypothetical protein [Sulfurovum xiamenensis]MDM5263943.1 hypothetical protein [Sulfurovum xiamenensis]
MAYAKIIEDDIEEIKIQKPDYLGSFIGALMMGAVAAYIGEAYVKDMYNMSNREADEVFFIVYGITILVSMMIIYTPKRAAKAEANKIKKKVEKEKAIDKKSITGIWKDMEDKFIQVFKVNGIPRAFGKKDTDLSGEVYFYTEINGKIHRSKIISFQVGQETMQNIQTTLISNKIETQNKGVFIIHIMTEDGNGIEIKSNIKDGRKMESDYLYFKHLEKPLA